MKILDLFFLIFHTALVIFNLFGWLWKRTRRANLVTLLLTGLSWVGLGIFYGLGYCPLTDWHFKVLEHLGESNLPYSYMLYLVERISGFRVEDQAAEIATLVFYLLALILSIFYNIRDSYSRRLVK